MSAESVIESHPLRLLDEGDCLPKGELGLLLARSGVGKSALLINFALDRLLQGKQVLHFCTGMTSEKTHQYYQEIFSDHQRHYPDSQEVTWTELDHRFMVISYLDAHKMTVEMDEEIRTILDNVKMSPKLVLVDGLDFDEYAEDHLKSLKATAQKYKFRILASMCIHRNPAGEMDLEKPVSIAQRYTEHLYLMEPRKDRICLEHYVGGAWKELPIYFCPHDFILKAR